MHTAVFPHRKARGRGTSVESTPHVSTLWLCWLDGFRASTLWLWLAGLRGFAWKKFKIGMGWVWLGLAGSLAG